MTNPHRKTVKVASVLDKVNRALEVSPDENVEGRKALAWFLESVLFETGNYKGFRYTDGAKGDKDDSRRWYFGGRDL